MFTTEQLLAVRAIREPHGDRQLTICGKVSAEIERQLGFAKVMGWYEGTVGGPRIHTIHAWNTHDGLIIDATGDQFGLDRYNVVHIGHPSYVPFTDKEVAFVERFTRQNGKAPDNFDMCFVDMEEEEAEEFWDEEDDLNPSGMHPDDLAAMGWDIDDDNIGF